MRIPTAFALAAAVSAYAAANGAAQTVAVPPAVFLDCQADACDSSHIRNEIRFVDWMRDRADADVHLLVTAEETAAGGRRYRVSMSGSGRFNADNAEIVFTTGSVTTFAERRDGLTARIAQGLVRYAVHTDAASQVEVRSAAALPAAGTAEAGGASQRDPWKRWVFETAANAEIEGESRERQRQFELSFTAQRTTEDWRIEVGIEGTYDEQSFELSDRRVRSVRRDYEFDVEIAGAIHQQWSTGIATEVGTSSFENQDLFARTAAVLEYSFFPYSEFSRRRVTLQYSVGARYYDYGELTVYDRFTERRTDHELALAVEFRQRWGSASAEVSGAHFLDSVRQHNVSSWANINVRLFRGLSLDLYGSYERLRDQIYIPKGDASDDEVLLQRRALETGYRYDTSVGLRYTFGSIFNNVVNPRLGG